MQLCQKIPFPFSIHLYFVSLYKLRKFNLDRTSLITIELNHITGLAKFCGIQFALIVICWGPFAMLCTYILLANANNINIYASIVPHMMAKVCIQNIICSVDAHEFFFHSDFT